MVSEKKEASHETILRLLDNIEKSLSQLELSLPLIMENRQALDVELNKQGDNNAITELLLVVFDIILAENEVIYDLSVSLKALLKAKDDYTKRYYMQSLNLCFWESCQVFVGQKNDNNGLLQRLERLCSQLNLVECQFLINPIIEEIQVFRNEYVNRTLRDITRHYDHPIKMYKEVHKLDNIDFFAKGASQLMALRMKISVISLYLQNPLMSQRCDSPLNVSLHSTGIVQKVNEVVIKKLGNKDFKGELQKVLSQAQKVVDGCYRHYDCCTKAIAFLEENGLKVPNVFEKMESLIFLRMEALYLRYDVACSVWGYLNASSDKERSQNLRLIHITKQAALTHIFGYTENTKKNSLWSKIKSIDEVSTEKLDTEGIEKRLEELTNNLAADNQKSRMYAHYRYKENFYIPSRLDAFEKMLHATELNDSLKLLSVCKSLDKYTFELLVCIYDNQEQERKRKYAEWMGKIEQLVAPKVKGENNKDGFKPLRDLLELAYGDYEKVLRTGSYS